MVTDIREWIKDAREGFVTNLHVASLPLAKELRIAHMRSGRVSPRISKEAASHDIIAYGYDELGDIWALCRDGYSRQFFRN